MRVVGLTHRGRERSRNEDSYLFRTGEGIALLAVADGLGGHLAGDVASALAVEVLARFWDSLDPKGPLPARQLSEIVPQLIRDANRAILAEAAADPGRQGMGTTLTMGLLSGRSLAVGHVGDSRAYLIGENKIELLTTDHSLVEEMVQQGEIKPAEARLHPRRHILTKALGTGPDVEIDLVERTLAEDSTLLFCTDGLTSLVSDVEILGIINYQGSNLEKAAALLIEQANARGGHDNITVVLAKFF